MVAAVNFRQNNFDFIRLVAALQVAIVHASEHFHLEYAALKWIQCFPGVPIFFVISGFLISASWDRSDSVLHYVQNRFLRIFPAMWVCLILTICSIFAFYDPVASLFQWGGWIVAQSSIGQFYNPDFLRGYGVGVVNGSMWTIPVELQFYMLVPFIYIVMRWLRWRLWFIALVMVALIAVNQLLWFMRSDTETLVVKLFSVTVLPYLYMFMCGVVFQRFKVQILPLIAHRFTLFFGVFVVATAGLMMCGVDTLGNDLSPVSAILLSVCVISLAYSWPGKLSGILRHQDISYGVYIYHMVVVNALLALGYAGAGALIGAVGLSIIIAIVSWFLIEKPALSLKKKAIYRHEKRMF